MKRTTQREYLSFLFAAPVLGVAFFLAIERHMTPYAALSNDLQHYMAVYQSAWASGFAEFIREYRFEPGFTALFKMLSGWLPFLDYLIINQFVYFGSLFYLCKKVTPNSWSWAALALTVAVFLPTNYLMSSSALRQSLAMSMLFIALGYLMGLLRVLPKEKVWRNPVFVGLLFSGVLFHYSMALIAVLVIVSLLLPRRLLFRGWLVLLALYATEFPGLRGLLHDYLYPLINASSTGDEAAAWTTYTTGFKITWLAMSGVPLVCYLLLRIRAMMSSSVMALFNTYWALNGFCLLLIDLPFSDRFFHYSWSLVAPILAVTLVDVARPIIIRAGLLNWNALTVNDYHHQRWMDNQIEVEPTSSVVVD